jgi:sugar (pentulose or hexulose) kinase
MRYVCAGLDAFTLVSTGTWSIAFDRSAALDQLVEERDTNTNTDVLGRAVACSRFFGGREFELVAAGAPAEAASVAGVQELVRAGAMALPSFSDSGGPVPGTGGRGRRAGPPPQGAAGQASLAALYCAQMVSEQLDAIASRHDIIVDGPFARNGVLMAILAQLRRGQKVLASDLRDGTTAGAAAIALIDGSTLPTISIGLTATEAAAIAGLDDYHAGWRKKAYAQAP